MSDYHLKYHLMPPNGWLNDPNGLCQYNSTYHIFYQYCKDVYGKSAKYWGHYTTKDFKNYKDENIAFYPDTDLDKDGVYSGSCLIDDGMHIFYTGNVKLDGNYDYTYKGRLSNTIHVFSKDGITYSDKQVVLANKDYPSDLTCHIRDPKVYKEDNHYYMVLGARDENDVGCVLVYNSNDLINWHYTKRIKSKDKFGYMWECPDLFKLDDDTFLITCPQGIKQEGYLYENDNQNGYFKVVDNIALDYQTLDYGIDFYAPQSFIDEKGRRILIAWLGLPDSPYLNLSVNDGWQNALSLPREIKNIRHQLYQYPIKEIQDLMFNTKKLLISSNDTILSNRICQIHFSNLKDNFVFNINNLSIKYENGLFCLVFNNDKTKRDSRHFLINKIDDLDIFLDSCVIEIYLNKGEKVISSMFYDEYDCLKLSSNIKQEIEYSEMETFNIR